MLIPPGLQTSLSSGDTIDVTTLSTPKTLFRNPAPAHFMGMASRAITLLLSFTQ